MFRTTGWNTTMNLPVVQILKRLDSNCKLPPAQQLRLILYKLTTGKNNEAS